MFDGNIGTWHGKPYDIKLKSGAEPYHGKPFPVPRIHELTFKQELDQLEALRIINKVNRYQWGAPTFLIPKKDITVPGPAFSRRGNLACARARGAGPPRTVEHRYLPNLGRYRTLLMRAMD